VLHRPPSRPLAAVLLLSLVDYALWNWSLGAGHDLLALVAGLALIPLLIVLAWLVFLSATRLAGGAARRIHTGAATRARRRVAATSAGAGPAEPADAARRAAAGATAREHHVVGGAGNAGDGKAAAAPSSKLAA
jgi:hypothetical protein